MIHTSAKERWAIIAYWKLSRNEREAQRLSKQPRKVVRRWVKRYLETGDVKDVPKSGRRRLLSAEVGQLALDQLLKGEAGGAKSVARNLHAAGHTTEAVAKQTVVRAASKVAEDRGEKLRSLRGEPFPELDADSIAKRLKFCTANRTRSWGTVMFTDRKKFTFSYPGVKVQPVTWVLEGSQHPRRTALITLDALTGSPDVHSLELCKLFSQV
jgi:hypothetical protein